MSRELVIVFVKNITLGKVKTRLAKTIGNEAASEVYRRLVAVTEDATKKLGKDIRIYFSNAIVDDQWNGTYKAIQKGHDLGERMKNAFEEGFKDGYDRIVLIGSDLPDLDVKHLTSGLDALHTAEVVFGPAIDGGYYLIGLSTMQPCVFNDKPWSRSNLLNVTLDELKQNDISHVLLEPLNDIDTFEDLQASDFYKNDKVLQQRIKQLHD